MELISYAADFVSFFLQNFKDVEKIKSIVLFGSVARGEETKKSDVDIFVDVFSGSKVLEKKIGIMKDDFFDSRKFKDYWKLMGIENDINIIVGKLDEWNLKDTILGSSIILYGKYSSRLDSGENKVILYWDVVKDNSKRVMLNKKLKGFSHYGKKYEGFLDIYGGVKLGANAILIPVEELNLFLKEFKRFGAKVRIRRVFEYEN